MARIQLTASAGAIAVSGAEIYGDGWEGPAQARDNILPIVASKESNHLSNYPKINFALGSLRQKGLVHRYHWDFITNKGYAAGRWRLTDQGKLLMGFDPQ